MKLAISITPDSFLLIYPVLSPVMRVMPFFIIYLPNPFLFKETLRIVNRNIYCRLWESSTSWTHFSNYNISNGRTIYSIESFII